MSVCGVSMAVSLAVSIVLCFTCDLVSGNIQGHADYDNLYAVVTDMD